MMLRLRRAERGQESAAQAMDRRKVLGMGAATVAGAAVGTVAGAPSAGAQTVPALRTGTLIFAPNELSKQAAVTGLTSSSVAFATVQSPLPSNVFRNDTPVAAAKPDRATGTLTVEIHDELAGNRFWNVKVAWLVIG